MIICDALGWAACVMTLITFAQQRMLSLRVTAIFANVFFIGYGALGHYLPVLALHLALLPLNCQRLLSLALTTYGRDLDSIPALRTNGTAPEEHYEGSGRSRRVPREELIARLTRELPNAVDKYTPEGRLPSEGSQT